MVTEPQKRTGVDITLRITETFVVIAGIAFWAHRAMRADAGYELLALMVGLLIAVLILLVGGIVQFRRRKTDSGGIALMFLFAAVWLGWAVLSRAARAY
jgi:hypothetical protein